MCLWSCCSSPEPEVRPVVHVGLVAVIDLAAEELGQGEPGAEGPGPAQPHPDHLDGVVGGRGLRDRGEEHRGHPDIDRGEEHYTVILKRRQAMSNTQSAVWGIIIIPDFPINIFFRASEGRALSDTR